MVEGNCIKIMEGTSILAQHRRSFHFSITFLLYTWGGGSNYTRIVHTSATGVRKPRSALTSEALGMARRSGNSSYILELNMHM